MPERVRKAKPKPAPRKTAEAPAETEAVEETEAAAALKAELDDLLDEIDEVLETNAAEFVAQYVQRGGQ